jgi:hypothetical protein
MSMSRQALELESSKRSLINERDSERKSLEIEVLGT